MTVLALTVALMSGGLLQERQPPPQMHLVDTQTLEFVAGGLLGATNADLDVMSLQQLQAERQRLEDGRRGLVAPIVLLSVGAALVVTGSIFLYTNSLALVLVGAGMYVVGGVLVVVGTIMLIVALVNNGKTNSRLRRVDERIQAFSAPPPPGMPPPGQGDAPPPPPPPMPPPASNWQVPQTDLLVAQF